MKKDGYYSSGEFAQMAHITKKTIRYYDEHDILKPSYVTPYGARYYTDQDFAKLQQILLFKQLGFSLKDIKEMTLNGNDALYMENSLKLQLKLVEDRIEQFQIMAQMMKDTLEMLHEGQTVDWNNMLDLLHLMGMESSMKSQYQNSSNISARISLHNLYASNSRGWFPWIYDQCPLEKGIHVLEVGCGDGTFWLENKNRLPEDIHIVLSDISSGMLRDARRRIGAEDPRFLFQAFDCQKIPFPDQSFDLVIANHVLFYCENIEKACKEISRVMKPGAHLICSTYGKHHMEEVRKLASDFDERIVLSSDQLYERFGKENGQHILSPFFSKISWLAYKDSLLVTQPQPLISYILSCHGNQNQYIPDRYQDFRAFVEKQTNGGFHITKDAGIFLCQK